MLDLSKKLIIGSLVSLFLGVLTFLVGMAMVSRGNVVNAKTESIFVLIFALASLVIIGISAFVVYKDGMAETRTIIVLSAVGLTSVLLLAGSSLLIDAINNPALFGQGTKGSDAFTLEIVSAIFIIPTVAVAGYDLAH